MRESARTRPTRPNIRWANDYYADSGADGGYVNFMSSDDYRAAANYGNHERLAAVKATYDPDNLFHINQNIAPAIGAEHYGFREAR